MGPRATGQQAVATVVVDKMRRRMRQNGYHAHITLQVNTTSTRPEPPVRMGWSIRLGLPAEMHAAQSEAQRRCPVRHPSGSTPTTSLLFLAVVQAYCRGLRLPNRPTLNS